MERLNHIPVKGFIENSFVDWPGMLCAVVFLPGCNFRCPYCHNAELVLRPDALQDVDWTEIADYLHSQRGWIDGVCISGGEPTLHRGLPDVFRAVRAMGLAAKLDTNGSNPAMLEALMAEGLLDYVAMDVKSCLDEQHYCMITGAANMFDAVKQSIRILLGGSVDYEFRTTVVPTFHKPDDIFRLAAELNGAPRLRIQNFSPSESILDPRLKNLQPFTDEQISSIQQRVDRLIAPSCRPV